MKPYTIWITAWAVGAGVLGRGPLRADLLQLDQLDPLSQIPQDSAVSEAGVSPAPAPPPVPASPPPHQRTPPAPERPRSQPKSAAPATVSAKAPPRQREPVEFRSHTLEGSQISGQITLTGQVWLRQDELEIRADQATLHFDGQRNSLTEVHAHGNVNARQEDPITGEKLRAVGKILHYKVDDNRVILRGDAELYRDSDVVRGQVIRYQIGTGIMQVEDVKGELQSSPSP